MAACGGGGSMEGWLYIFANNRFGLQVSRKRYFILKENFLRNYKDKPISLMKEPNRSAIIDSSVRVHEHGRESINKKLFFIFTIYNASNQRDQLKLGASSSEEAARWIHSFQDAALKEYPYPGNKFSSSIMKKNSSLRMGGTKGIDQNDSIEWNFQSCIYTEAMNSDINDPSPWKIFGCHNGLRLFKEAKDCNSRRSWGDLPVMMSVGVVDGTSETIFHTLMALGSSRSEWDFCIYQGSVIDHLDGHTDIIHLQLYSDWLPWGMKPRDLLLRRYWRREDDGTYVVLFHSVHHKKCPPDSNYVRATLKSGAYLVSPVNKGKQSLVKHMLHMDWKIWKSYLRPSSARTLTIRMLERVAALRELFRTKGATLTAETIEVGMDIGLPQSEKEEIKVEVQQDIINAVENFPMVEDEAPKEPSRRTSLVGLNDADDEFFDVPEPLEYVQLESDWQYDMPPEQNSHQTPFPPKLPTPSDLVKKLHGFAVQKKGYMDLQEVAPEENIISVPSFGTTLLKDSNCALPCSWNESDPSLFLIRGKKFLRDHRKVKTRSTLMELVGADWLRSDTRQDNLSSLPGSIVQQYAARGGSEFFIVVNFQVPGKSLYALALYYMMKTPLQESNALLQRFVDGDDAYRNSRFKLIPYISEGAWIVKHSVGNKACLMGQALDIHYIRGSNYLELDIDVGSSTVARGVANIVLGYLNNSVIELAFLVQGNSEEELPEVLLGTCRLNHLDASKALFVLPP